MAKILTKKTSLFLKSGGTLPTAPANFLEVQEELLLTPNIPIEEFKRINGLLGSNASYADACHTTISQTIGTKMRYQNSAADSLDDAPEYGELLKIGGFDEDLTCETLKLADATGVSVGDTLTGDTSSASGTVVEVDTTTDLVVLGTVTGGPFTVTGEGVNTAAYTSTSAGFSPRYANTQTPVLGSAVAYIDGKKHQMTGSLAAALTFNFPIGKAATINAALSAFLDNSGVAATEANPTVTLNTESVMLTGCADIMTAGGTTLTPDNVSIDMGADIQEFYGMGALKEYNLTDYVIKVTADFYPENADYNDAVEALAAGTTEALLIQLGTVAGVATSGKTVEINCALAQANSFSDSADKSTVKRSMTWLLGGTNQISLKTGFFA